MAGHSTPTGLFSILQKNRYHESNIYSGAPMPYMQRITWSGVALHQGHLPGYPASHGCIRLPESVALQLWGMTRIGQRIIVAPRDAAVVPFAHAQLPIPVWQATPEESAPAVAGETTARPARRAAAMMMHRVSTQPAVEPEDRLLNPIEFAQSLRIKVQRDAAEAAQAARAALAESAERSAAAHRATAFLREQRRLIETLEARLNATARAADQGQHRDSLEATVALGGELEHELEEAEDRLAYAVAEEREASDIAFAAAREARDAESRAEALVETIRATARRLEPISIFISRKEGRVFIRQGFVPVLDAPVTILEPERPLGTHLLVAMQAAGGAGSGLSWVASTVAGETEGAVVLSSAGRVSRERRSTSEAPAYTPDSAAGALARIALPEDVRRLIAERVWTGAAITITDLGHSSETGKGTDFIVLTR